MNDTKAIRILWQLPSKDWMWLEKYLQSPALSNHQQVFQLFQFLKYRWSRGLSVPSKEDVVLKITPKPSITKLNHLASYLYQSVLDYLAWSNYQEHSTGRAHYLAEALQERGLYDFIPPVLEKSNQILEELPLRNAEYLQDKLATTWREFQNGVRLKRSQDFDLRKLNMLQDNAFLTQRFKYACIIRNHQIFVEQSDEEGMLPLLFSYVRDQMNLDEAPVLRIYLNAYLTMSGETQEERDDSFMSLQTYLSKDQKMLTLQEIKDLHLVQINYCIRQINRRRFDFLEPTYQLYLTGIEAGFLLDKGVLSNFTYKNTVTVGLKLKEFESVRHFLETHKSSLKEEFQEHSYLFNLARYHYETNNLDEARPILMRVKFKDLHHVLAAKILLLKIFVEQEEWALIENHLRAFKTFLRRKGIQSYHQENYRNFAVLLKKTVRFLSKNGSNTEKTKLIAEIKTKEVLTDRSWFFEVLEYEEKVLKS